MMVLLNASTGAEETGSRQIHRAAAKSCWAARRGTILTWTLYPLVVLAAISGARVGLGLSWPWVLLPALAAIVPIHRALPTTRSYTVEELRAFRPLMSLSVPEAAYLDVLLEAYGSGLDAATRGEVLPAMRRLVDESVRLDRLEGLLAERDSVSVRTELDAMRAQLFVLGDETAREALRHAVEIAERRLASSISETAARERIAAHRAMVSQSALAARETVRRLRLSPEVATSAFDLDLSALRRNAEETGREVASLEAAVQEMRAS